MNDNRQSESKKGSNILIIAAVFVIAVAAVFATGKGILSPGPLSAQASIHVPLRGVSSHAQLSGNCGACHAPPWSAETMAQRCLACHTSITGDLQAEGTLHGMFLPPGTSLTCREGCHVEHRGAAANLTSLGTEHSPANDLGYSLQAHQTTSDGQPFACLDCHRTGLGRFDETVCYNCHYDIAPVFAQAHRDAFGLGCLQCHDGIDTYGQAWGHDRGNYKLSGKHAVTDCGQCHAGARNVFQLKAAPRVCSKCHQKDDAHQDTLGPDCSQCHDTTDWRMPLSTTRRPCSH